MASWRVAARLLISRPDQHERRQEGVFRYPDQPERSQKGVSRVPQLQTSLKSDHTEQRERSEKGEVNVSSFQAAAQQKRFTDREAIIAPGTNALVGHWNIFWLITLIFFGFICHR